MTAGGSTLNVPILLFTFSLEQREREYNRTRAPPCGKGPTTHNVHLKKRNQVLVSQKAIFNKHFVKKKKKKKKKKEIVINWQTDR